MPLTSWKIVRRAVCAVLLACGGLPATLATPAMAGHWVVNKHDSDDPRDRLKGLSLLHEVPSPSAAERDRQGQATETRVYGEIDLAKERRKLNTAVDVGELSRVLGTDTIGIAEAPDGYVLTYQDGLTREIRPRAGGPVYSAEGDEFVASAFGRSQVYWRGQTLVIETLLEPRGQMFEELRLLEGGKRLEIHTRLSNPDWITDADVLRIFDPAP
jgi:hypothetical protein